jgi:two-component system sensor histidine kinase KdpD
MVETEKQISSAPESADAEVISLTAEREKEHRRLLSAVAHDLKTPLATIIGSLEAYEKMKATLSPEKQQTLIHLALQEAYRLDGFIANVLNMAKFEYRTVEVRKETALVMSIIQNSLSLYRHRLGQCPVTVIAEGDDKISMTTDPALFGQALGFVLDNAMKFAVAKAIVPAVDIHYGSKDGSCYVAVHDNGPGLPNDKLEEIFDKYVRLSGEEGNNACAGLGLAICREIMQLLGGTVVASNRVGGGATFTLRVPKGSRGKS